MFEKTTLRNLTYNRVFPNLFISYPEVWKLPSFDVDIPEDCFNKSKEYIKWKEYYEKYREEMCDALKINDNDVKNHAADEVKRKYKKVVFF